VTVLSYPAGTVIYGLPNAEQRRAMAFSLSVYRERQILSQLFIKKSCFSRILPLYGKSENALKRVSLCYPFQMPHETGLRKLGVDGQGSSSRFQLRHNFDCRVR